MKRSTRAKLNLIGFLGGTLLVVAAVLGVAWVLPSHMEARAYNHATGAHVSTWDAMFVDLRVQGAAK